MIKERADVKRNRNAIIDVALKMFKEKGPDFSLVGLAKQSGLSRMTFYRYFPDKSAVIGAVFCYNLEQLEKISRTFSADGLLFFELLKIVVKQRIQYNLFVPYLNEEDSTETGRKLIEVFKDPVAVAKEAGYLRADFDLRTDLLLLLTMIASVSANFPDPMKTNASRIFTFLIGGLGGEKTHKDIQFFEDIAF
ncbi:TetR/AcrR family transcriptional regulator [Sphingobacterium griseoflavum]|uniref:HTH tetR-type domain-containing protein n=1 Tax=Sphingobacterium griseoflavum TaxID=1474952 RepID=A0ABQ3HSG6_9SPHI|nr:TetR/AcrR family transcriptional regulator [Sphingobacterium griseoflavum]GHE29831.1 hypothetical protein GCM10017764_11090 [Sphingobacterium griseoflavum]